MAVNTNSQTRLGVERQSEYIECAITNSNTATTISLIKLVVILLEPNLMIPPAQCVSINIRQVMKIKGLSEDMKDRERRGKPTVASIFGAFSSNTQIQGAKRIIAIAAVTK